MAMELPERLQQLSDELHREEMSLLMERCAYLFLDEPPVEKSQEDLIRENTEEWSAGVLMQAMRIQLCLELLEEGHRSCLPMLKESWHNAVDNVQKLEYSMDVTGQILSDTLELVLVLNPSRRKALLRQLDLRTRLKIKESRPLSRRVKFTALAMADYCQKTDRTELLRQIVQNLILLSQERNAEHPGIHRIIVVDALRRVVDLDHSLTVRLCENQRQYFEDVVNEESAGFFWLYGMAVLSLKDITSAVPLLRRCHELCMAVEGETSWVGMRANSVVQYSLLDSEQTEAAEAYLWDTLKKMKAGYYPNMDASADLVAAYTRVALLIVALNRGELREHEDDIWALMEYCNAHAEDNRNPLLTPRYAQNLLSGYFLETGDYLQAALNAQLALSYTPRNNLPKEPSDLIIYTNLLMYYTQLHDGDRTAFYLQKLIELSDEWENNPFLSDRIMFLLSGVEEIFHADILDPVEDLQYLRELCDNIRDPDICTDPSFLDEYRNFWSVFGVCANLLNTAECQRDDLLRIRDVTRFFWDHPERFQFQDPQCLIYHIFQAQIEAQLEGPDVLTHLDRSWQYMDALAEGRGARITLLRFAAVNYFKFGRREQALAAANMLLSDITAAWQLATTYFNDRRVCQLLSTVQDDFLACCAVLQMMVSSEELYEQILRFKDLPALVGRERNTLLRQSSIDTTLIQDLHTVQDRLAAAELNDQLRGTDTAREIREQLENIEGGLAAQFHEPVRFTEITFDRVCRKLPDNHAIVEYYFVPGQAAISPDPLQEDDLELDIFVTVKRGGQAQLHHLRISEGFRIIEETENFISILQATDDAEGGRKAELRASLYRTLIAPVLPFLEGVTGLYLAPDAQLCNLPFEILHADGSDLLQARYKLCRLVCGRDLLFFDDLGPAGGSLILGDPNYESNRGQRLQSLTQGRGSGPEPVEDLPFSGIEAQRVAQRCRCQALFGDAATKYALRDSLPCGIIHLATHGMYEETPKTDSLYSSQLVFAGYNKWARNQTESSHCGNGVLTADEISRMDLRRTELVALSACRSGLGDTSYGSVRGLLSAFSAAGSRWIISHLWEANDFATPILMDAFYDGWLNRGRDVPDALQYAKRVLRTMTIEDLDRAGWLDPPADDRISDELRAELRDMRSWPQDETPFADEFFWGGFTVHKCR